MSNLGVVLLLYEVLYTLALHFDVVFISRCARLEYLSLCHPASRYQHFRRRRPVVYVRNMLCVMYRHIDLHPFLRNQLPSKRGGRRVVPLLPGYSRRSYGVAGHQRSHKLLRQQCWSDATGMTASIHIDVLNLSPYLVVSVLVWLLSNKQWGGNADVIYQGSM